MQCHISVPFLLGLTQLWPCQPASSQPRGPGDNPPSSLLRSKRGWVWNQFYVQEEQPVTDPVLIGQLKSDSDRKDGSFQYILTGDGAGSTFVIDEKHGDIFLTKKLDREEKSFYTLRGQVIDRNTKLAVEPESEFIVKVQDINDNEPRFLDGPYVASVPEMSPEGTSVIQVTARDDDDPSYGNSARLLYSILHGQPYFSVEPTTGVIRISSQMDRETKDQYLVIIQAKDMVGQMGGLSGTTTVIINLSDVNDNMPVFQQKLYHMTVSESADIGTSIGVVMADDSDIGENAEVIYLIEEDGSHTFDIIIDNETQEGIVILKKKLDYERQRHYSIRAQVINRYIDERFVQSGALGDTTIIKIKVEDADEPPEFLSRDYVMGIPEDASVGSSVGTVTARDPDVASNAVRYSITGSSSLPRMFSINRQNGTIITTKPLDREMAAWHNLTVSATETKNPWKVSEVSVRIRVLDVNDHAPEFSQYYETYVCENANADQLIETISAIDGDDSVEDHHFYFYMSPEAIINSNFTVKDNQDNTAAILTRKNGFSRQEQPVFYVPILIEDNGIPSLTSTNTLTINVCDCNVNGSTHSCHYGALMFSMGFSTEALIAILACTLTLLVVVLVVLSLRQRRKPTLFPEKGEEFRENIVRYDDEGGGEEDTEAFDIAALRTRTVMRERKTRQAITTEIRSLYRQSLQVGPDSAVFREFIAEKLEEANSDPCAPPYDSLQTYAFEGKGSLTGSLSSLESSVSDQDQNYDYLSELGPRFQKLAILYSSSGRAKN
ncbi:cadherin-19 [Tachyglossus aculeatus]|uniref:cadherin-19 n=1 Tax=Tachyglossus aculeatus TaxID=9261 RepID=UPI0018F7A5F6|nr:cadherin-19 [Tachyglossus aculeatus]